jgi:hypothetical protein
MKPELKLKEEPGERLERWQATNFLGHMKAASDESLPSKWL